LLHVTSTSLAMRALRRAVKNHRPIRTTKYINVHKYAHKYSLFTQKMSDAVCTKELKREVHHDLSALKRLQRLQKQRH